MKRDGPRRVDIRRSGSRRKRVTERAEQTLSLLAAQMSYKLREVRHIRISWMHRVGTIADGLASDSSVGP
jgi:hypothetical protein